MKQIIFPGNFNQPSVAQYGIFFEKGDSYTRKAHIVVVQTFGGDSGTSLINSDEGRSNILTRILDQDLNGVRTDFVAFSLIYIASESRHGFRFPIHFDLEDYVKRGNPHDSAQAPPTDFRSTVLNLIGKGDKQYTIFSYDVVGGCTRFCDVFNEREHLSGDEIDRLLAAVNFKKESQE
jgi:hypothetical protein